MTHRHEPLVARERRLSLVDRLQVVLDRARREHASDIIQLFDHVAASNGIATPDGKRRYVRALFATIADRYDFITVALSYGQDRRWKRRVIALAAAAPGLRVLDLATGTGDIAFAAAARGARVVGLDITLPDDRAGEAQSSRPRRSSLSRGERRRALHFLVGDMLALPFPAASFDIVTTGYGLRNVPDLPHGDRRNSAACSRRAARWCRSISTGRPAHGSAPRTSRI